MAAVIYLLFLFIPPLKEKFHNTQSYAKLLLVLALLGLTFKSVFQGFLVIPPIAEVSTIIRNFMIGYVQLIKHVIPAGTYWLEMGLIGYYYEISLLLTDFLPLGLIFILILNKHIYSLKI